MVHLTLALIPVFLLYEVLPLPGSSFRPDILILLPCFIVSAACYLAKLWHLRRMHSQQRDK